ncbi:MAG: hypothetical protein ACKVS5_08820 [Parvularculaceae bacterium]
MTNDNANLPATLPPGPPEIEAETVGTAVQTLESEPNARPPAAPAASAPRSPGMIMLALFAALLAIASALYFSRTRTPAPGDAATGTGAASNGVAPITIEVPGSQQQPAAAGAHDAPSADSSGIANPSPEKIFNDAGSFKESLSSTGPARALPDGTIPDLPPAPHALPDGASANDALRNAAKAASRAPPADDPQAEQDPAPDARLLDPEAYLSDFGAPALATLRNDAKRALAFAALAAKARSGEPFAAELGVYLSNDLDAPLSAAIAARAPAGISTLATLSARFPGYRNKALAAGRRAEAKGPAARLAASLASLVNLRPARPLPGSTSAAILSRAEGALALGNLAGALAELTTLNADAAAALAPWMSDTMIRLTLEEALAAREQALYASLDAAFSGGPPGR